MPNQVCQGAYGPLRPPNKAKIPLWMAVNLKLKKKCHIVAPDWLNVGAFVLYCNLHSFIIILIDYLQARLTLEISQPAFSELPFRFAEVAKVILDVSVALPFFYCSQCSLNCCHKVLQTISKTQTNFVHS
jgi:hypothetical protein